MTRKITLLLFFVLGSIFYCSPSAFAAEETSKEAIMRNAAMEGGRISNSEKTLFKQSIRTAKESVARETLDVFYRDALDAYYASRYDEAMELLNNIYSVDPTYEDVSALREKIKNIKEGRQIQSQRGQLDSFMRQGNEARKQGRSVQAINFWKQALAVNPNYKPALKKIQEVNKELAQQQYEEGYRNYKKQDYEQSLDNWSNAIALDPALKERGLLVMMTKTQMALQKGQTTRLSTRASELVKERNYQEALATYEQLLTIEPRNEEARRMSSKLKIQLGGESFASAKNAMAEARYTDAVRHYQDCVRYGYELERSQSGLREAQSIVQASRKPVIKKKEPSSETKQPVKADTAEAAPPVRKRETNPEEANKNYRLGLAAIRNKDYHHAVELLELAAEYDPENEHIYVAKERAKLEWAALNSAR